MPIGIESIHRVACACILGVEDKILLRGVTSPNVCLLNKNICVWIGLDNSGNCWNIVDNCWIVLDLCLKTIGIV